MIWIYVIVGLTFFGSMLGAYGVYKFGDLENYINLFRSRNMEYQSEIEKLGNTKNDLVNNVQHITHSVDNLKESAEEMNKILEQFDQVRESLQAMCEKNGEMHHIGDLVDSLLLGCEEVREITTNNEKAALLSAFYGQCYRNEPGVLDKDEYKRFMCGMMLNDECIWYSVFTLCVLQD